MDAMYTTEALATGAGRNGHATVKDSDLDFTLAIPKEMGGSGEGANPEQLLPPATPPASTPRCRPWPATRRSSWVTLRWGHEWASESRAKASSSQ